MYTIDAPGNKTPVRQSRYGTRTHTPQSVNAPLRGHNDALPVVIERVQSRVPRREDPELGNSLKRPQANHSVDACQRFARARSGFTSTTVGGSTSAGRPNHVNAPITNTSQLRRPLGSPVLRTLDPVCRPQPSHPIRMTRNCRRHNRLDRPARHKHFDSCTHSRSAGNPGGETV